MSVLHITNWYPNRLDPIDGQFIKDHIDALHRYTPCDVMHIQVRRGGFAFYTDRRSEREQSWILVLPFTSWFVFEILSSWLLFWFLLTRSRKKYSVINFHIAYPLLTYFKWFKKLVSVPTAVHEHWSAYHFDLNATRDPVRVKDIFRHHDNLVTVSQALANDIIRFSGNSKLRTFVLPNVLNPVFIRKPDAQTRLSGNHFFMLSCWQFPKEPLLLLQAFKVLADHGISFTLRIGGYGPYEEAIKKQIVENGLTSCVSFIGKLSYEDTLKELRRSNYFVHASQYETFSVVCLEALSQGVPVVASAVGGIPEFVDPASGILIAENTVNHWVEGLQQALSRQFDTEEIEMKFKTDYSMDAIGLKYNHIISTIQSSRGK